MGVLQRYGTSNVHSRHTRPHVLRPNMKTLPDQTYNDTVAMNIGRKFDLTSCHLVRF